MFSPLVLSLEVIVIWSFYVLFTMTFFKLCFCIKKVVFKNYTQNHLLFRITNPTWFYTINRGSKNVFVSPTTTTILRRYYHKILYYSVILHAHRVPCHLYKELPDWSNYTENFGILLVQPTKELFIWKAHIFRTKCEWR